MHTGWVRLRYIHDWIYIYIYVCVCVCILHTLQHVRDGGILGVFVCSNSDKIFTFVPITLCNFALQRPISQITQCIRRISHNAPFCNRNVHAYAHFCYKMVHYGTGALWDLWIISIGSCYVGIRTYHHAELKVTLVHSHYKNISLERYKQTRNTFSVFIKNIQSFLRTSSFDLTNYERIIFCNKLIEFIRNVLFIFSTD